jgi:glycosyltransferase involved in cell wall biosynthesis
LKALFVHPGWPGQFAHLAYELATRYHWECTLLTSVDTSGIGKVPFTHINYRAAGREQPREFWNPPDLEANLNHAKLAYASLKNVPDYQPDLVVGHLGYGTILFLRELYPHTRFVGYFEILPAPYWTPAAILRPDYPPSVETRLAHGTYYHALTHLQLGVVDGIYAPTCWQTETLPSAWGMHFARQGQFRTIHDGIDCDLFCRQDRPLELSDRMAAAVHGYRGPIVTYVSRGLESVRGFDIFVKVARRICQETPDVVFLVAGQERTHYGNELATIGEKSFFEHVFKNDISHFDKIRFLGLIPIADLVTLFNLSDLHIYLTTPWVLSWSLLQAMACECTILASDTAPVKEVIESGQNGVLAGFYDVEDLAEKALTLLKYPRPELGYAARATVLERYELHKCAERLKAFFEGVQAPCP